MTEKVNDSEKYDEFDLAIEPEPKEVLVHVSQKHEYEDTVSPDYEEYLQTDLQDNIINEIFEELKSYVKQNALPICEFFEHEDVEDIINTCF